MYRHAALHDYFSSEFVPNTKDTYMLIFGPYDEQVYSDRYRELLAKYNGKEIYRSKQAVNFNYDHDKGRNTLVIFEFDEVSV